MLAARASVTVVTQPDRPAGRGQHLAPTAVTSAALALGLPVLTPTRLRAFAADVRAAAPDRCVVASYGRIVPQELLDAAPLWLNVHPSALPLYRGATPLQSVIRDGCRATAVSIIAMDAGMDTGDLLAQTAPLAIGPEETYGELHDRLAQVGAALLDETLAADARGTLVRTPQRERAAAAGIDDAAIARTVTRPWTKADTVLPADASARALVDRIRALAPKPGAQLPALVPHDDAPPLPPLKILRAHAVAALPDGARSENGSVVVVRGFIFLRASDGWVAVDELVPAGKAAMAMAAYANGRRADAAYAAVPA
jgi:methionyl-tRNA formyltransferase